MWKYKRMCLITRQYSSWFSLNFDFCTSMKVVCLRVHLWLTIVVCCSTPSSYGNFWYGLHVVPYCMHCSVPIAITCNYLLCVHHVCWWFIYCLQQTTFLSTSIIAGTAQQPGVDYIVLTLLTSVGMCVTPCWYVYVVLNIYWTLTASVMFSCPASVNNILYSLSLSLSLSPHLPCFILFLYLTATLTFVFYLFLFFLSLSPFSFSTLSFSF